jgi:hypothetical protein
VSSHSVCFYISVLLNIFIYLWPDYNQVSLCSMYIGANLVILLSQKLVCIFISLFGGIF